MISKKAFSTKLAMEATFPMSVAPLVLILLSISYGSVSATPVPQNFNQQQPYSGNYQSAGLQSFGAGFSGGSRQVQSAHVSSNNQFGNNNYDPNYLGQPNFATDSIRSGDTSANGNNDGLLTIIMLRIPPSHSDTGKISFSLQPNPTFEFEYKKPNGNPVNNNNYEYNNCQGSDCANPPLPLPPASGVAGGPGRCPPGQRVADNKPICVKST